ncbi:hypothetical protein NPIL_629051 [Nephila pilipes]|uniref:Uncharacterized protein n=1 Tax=Nephila pilipes TaxID=299642 RepID=A0A8X6QIC3_NEPPI|nr:hypothetical protein NPIL_629051 [Nephila pilipes]
MKCSRINVTECSRGDSNSQPPYHNLENIKTARNLLNHITIHKNQKSKMPSDKTARNSLFKNSVKFSLAPKRLTKLFPLLNRRPGKALCPSSSTCLFANDAGYKIRFSKGLHTFATW